MGEEGEWLPVENFVRIVDLGVPGPSPEDFVIVCGVTPDLSGWGIRR